VSQHRVRAPSGQLSTFTRERFEHEGVSHDVYRKGSGPAVLVLTEMPGISPQVLGFADRVAGMGCTAVLPDMFGTAGRDPLGPNLLSSASYTARTMASACISKEFTAFATGSTSPIVSFLRHLANAEHARCGGPGVGVVGMCFTGGFALAMAVEPCVIAPVMSQPSLPMPLSAAHRRDTGCTPAELAVVARRCVKEDLKVIGLRFRGDPVVPKERFATLKQALGDGFIAIELEQGQGHPKGPLPMRHSVLTGDLIDEPGEATRAALDQVLDLFRTKLQNAS
jgi:dienelactone hydrolase